MTLFLHRTDNRQWRLNRNNFTVPLMMSTTPYTPEPISHVIFNWSISFIYTSLAPGKYISARREACAYYSCSYYHTHRHLSLVYSAFEYLKEPIDSKTSKQCSVCDQAFIYSLHSSLAEWCNKNQYIEAEYVEAYDQGNKYLIRLNCIEHDMKRSQTTHLKW